MLLILSGMCFFDVGHLEGERLCYVRREHSRNERRHSHNWQLSTVRHSHITGTTLNYSLRRGSISRFFLVILLLLLCTVDYSWHLSFWIINTSDHCYPCYCKESLFSILGKKFICIPKHVHYISFFLRSD